jgi:uncharacterized protein (TIGR02594 family)
MLHGIDSSTPLGFLEKCTAHGITGGVLNGVSQKLENGSFRDGFLAGFASEAASPLVDKIPGTGQTAIAERTVLSATVGGTAAELGGGKFANGAVTAAFLRLYNDESIRAARAHAEDLLKIAQKELGIREIPGALNNPRIIAYDEATTMDASMYGDDTPWCSAFANWVVQKAGLSGTRSAAALSWMRWGADAHGPTLGAIAVIDYGRGQGHVAFVAGVTRDGRVILLGGNQSDSVVYRAFAASKISSYRVPLSLSSYNGIPVMRALLPPPVWQGFGASASYGATR